jgi:hypothetical protein
VFSGLLFVPGSEFARGQAKAPPEQPGNAPDPQNRNDKPNRRSSHRRRHRRTRARGPAAISARARNARRFRHAPRTPDRDRRARTTQLLRDQVGVQPMRAQMSPNEDFGFVNFGGQNGTFIEVNHPGTGTINGVMTNQLLGVNIFNIAVRFYVDTAGLTHIFGQHRRSQRRRRDHRSGDQPTSGRSPASLPMATARPTALSKAAEASGLSTPRGRSRQHCSG